MTSSKGLRLVTGLLELLLAIPFLGGFIVVANGYVPLGVMLILHIVTLLIASSKNEPMYGSVSGIVTSVLGWIPIVGWFLHLMTGVLLMISLIKR